MNARPYTPGEITSPQPVQFDGQSGTVEVGTATYTPDQLELRFPGYVLELIEGWPKAAVAAGFTSVILFGDHFNAGWQPAHTNFEAVLTTYPTSWIISFAGVVGIERASNCGNGSPARVHPLRSGSRSRCRSSAWRLIPVRDAEVGKKLDAVSCYALVRRPPRSKSTYPTLRGSRARHPGPTLLPLE